MEEQGSTVRLVRCPKCENLLPELPEYSVYQCGGCGAVLRGKQSTPARPIRPLEKVDNDNGTRVEPSTTVEVSLKSSYPNEKESYELEGGNNSTKGKIVHEKAPNVTPSSSSRKEKRGISTDPDQSRRRRLDFEYGMSSESQEISHPYGPIRSRPVGFHRNASTVGKGRFGSLPYSSEVPSTSHSSSHNSYGNHITNHGGSHELSRVQDLEKDRIELLKKLDDLRTQLSISCNVAENPNVRFNGSYPWAHQTPLPPQPSHQPPHHHYLPPTYHDSFPGYNQHDALLHRPTCSCSQCYNTNFQPIPPKVLPFSSYSTRETSYKLPGSLSHLPRHHRIGSFDFGKDSFGTRYPRRRVILTHGGESVSRPVSGGAPFISCCNCFELLKIPKGLH